MFLNSLQLHLDSLNATRHFAKAFAKSLQPGISVCLYGPIGCGKTTFVKMVLKELGVTENVTSPSFVIINEFYSGPYPIYHFDLYRLEEVGVNTIFSELIEYSSNLNVVIFVEWAEFSQGNLPDDRLELIFNYDLNFSDRRTLDVKTYGDKTNDFLERLKSNYANH